RRLPAAAAPAGALLVDQTPAAAAPAGALLVDQTPAAATAVLDADQAQPEPGERGPQPPLGAVLAQGLPERDEGDRGDRPQHGADRHGAHTVDIHRLRFGDFVRRLADLDLGDLWMA